MFPPLVLHGMYRTYRTILTALPPSWRLAAPLASSSSRSFSKLEEFIAVVSDYHHHYYYYDTRSPFVAIMLCIALQCGAAFSRFHQH